MTLSGTLGEVGAESQEAVGLAAWITKAATREPQAFESLDLKWWPRSCG
jgi:hypothetical protein